MNKQELINQVSNETQLKKAHVELMLNATISTIRTTVKRGQKMKLIGLGTFTKTKRKARNGRNPQTGQTLKLPAAWYPKFKAGSEFKQDVKN